MALLLIIKVCVTFSLQNLPVSNFKHKFDCLKGECAVVPTDKIEGRAYHQKFPLI